MRSFTFITFILCLLSCFAETIQDASQDSLKGAYLKYVPDGSYIVEVDDLDYSDTIQDASQDSLKRAFLKYVPDGSYIVKVGDIGYSDKNIAKSWLIIYAKTNEKCDGEEEKGIFVLHQTHENECYVACEDSNYFNPFVTVISWIIPLKLRLSKKSV